MGGKIVKKFFYNSALLIFLIIIFSITAAAEEINYLSIQSIKEETGINREVSIIDKKSADITGDHVEDQIYLIGQKYSDNIPIFYTYLEVIVYDINQKEFHRATYQDFSGYEPKIALYELTGDKLKDIFVESASAGSGGIYFHLILSFQKGNLKIIFDDQQNKGVNLTGEYKDGFTSVLHIAGVEEEIELNLSFNKSRYIREKIYDKNGKVLRDINPYPYPYSQLRPVDYDLDGNFELKGIQRIVGAYGADRIGYLESILKYESGWKVKEIKLSTFLRIYRPDYYLNKDKNDYNISRHSSVTKSGEVHFPQIENLPADVNSIYINKQLKETIKPFLNQTNQFKIDYKVVYNSRNILSIKYSGYQHHEGGKYEVIKSFNYDLKNNRRLNVENLFKNTGEVHQKVNIIIKGSIKDSSIKDKFPGIKEWMGFYIDEKEFTVYYLLNDYQTEFIEIAVPLSRIKEYLDVDIT